MKKLSVFLLSLLIIFMSFPLSVSAGEPYIYDNWQDNGKVDTDHTLLPGGVRAIKTITSTGQKNEYNVSIEVESKSEQTLSGRGIIFLVDTSSPSTLTEYKQLLKEVVPQIIGNQSNHIALAQIDKDFLIQTSFTDNLETINNKIDALNSKDANLYLEKGIREAAKLLSESTYDENILFILTEGNVKLFSKIEHLNSEVICSDDLHTSQKWIITPNYQMPYTAVSSINFNKLDVPSAYCQHGKKEQHIGKYPEQHIDTSVYESLVAKNDGTYVYTGSISSTSTALSQIGSSGFSTGTQEIKDNIVSSFSSPPTSEEKKVSIVLSDTLPEYITIDDIINKNNGSVSYDAGSNSINWVFDGNGSLNYNCVLDVKSANFPEANFPIADNTVVNYETNNIYDEFSLVQPLASGEFRKLYAVGALVNSDGHWFDGNNIVTNANEASIIGNKTPVLNENNVNRWLNSDQLIVSSDSLNASADYALFDTSQSNLSVDLTQLSVDTIYFKFVKIDEPQSNKYYIKYNYWYNGNLLKNEYLELDDDYVNLVEYIESVEGYWLSHAVFNDLNIDVTEPTSYCKTLTNQNNVLDIHYKPLYSIYTLSAVAHYDDKASYSFSSEIPYDSVDVTSLLIESKYNLVKVVFNGIDITGTEIVNLTKSGNDFELYFNRKPIPEEENNGENTGENSGNENEKPNDNGNQNEGNNNDDDEITPTPPPIIDPDKEIVVVDFNCSYHNSTMLEDIFWSENNTHNANSPLNLWDIYNTNNYNGKWLTLEKITVDKELITSTRSAVTLGESDFNRSLPASFSADAITENIDKDDFYVFSSGYNYKVYLSYKEKPDDLTGLGINNKGQDKTSPKIKSSSNIKIPKLDKNSEIKKVNTTNLAANSENKINTSEVKSSSEPYSSLPKTGANYSAQINISMQGLISSQYVVSSSAGGLIIVTKNEDE